jgi:hypothetical protein
MHVVKTVITTNFCCRILLLLNQCKKKKVLAPTFLNAILHLLLLLSHFCQVSNVKHDMIWHSKVQRKYINLSCLMLWAFLPCHCSYSIHCIKVLAFSQHIIVIYLVLMVQNPIILYNVTVQHILVLYVLHLLAPEVNWIPAGLEFKF